MELSPAVAAVLSETGVEGELTEVWPRGRADEGVRPEGPPPRPPKDGVRGTEPSPP